MANSVEDVDAAIRIRKWTDESQDFLRRVIPSLVEACEHLRRDTAELRSYVVVLQGEIDRLQREQGAIASAAEAHLTEIGRVASEAIRAVRTRDEVNDSDHQSSKAQRDGAVRRRRPKAHPRQAG